MDLSKYSQHDLTISALKANIKSIIFILPILIIFGIPYLLLWGNPFDSFHEISYSIPIRIIICLIIFVVGIFLHESIHGLFWIIFTKQGVKSIKFGILKTSMTPYCHCKEILKVKQYKIGVIMPAMVMGIVPSIVAIIIANPFLLIFGLIFTIAAAGDFLIIWMLRNEKNISVKDHPSKIGCIIYKEI